ncbi:2-dehydro-3-deoxy-D-gluconate 5-dehydrogenase KduD [Synoicihabitans lomoniglobus]|uniref:2-dehydro-3-deoxy-D-gluconate 5-dehydrogenase KduD n=1 Tax=Synoicihabitans lomoniglobus TaxID=2909285 RepID=A0AAE9ZY36_9BACT|nr:2-dehydro-3-deoxy-D-gluconate 5-dehydrogenase KduD [Opitutaceae bacterium LMO-M01]WED63283.1 2-dehydro-3-deoxy-D-gluconate 5-dehydrogenase KduD [Opitutaceae bacterium LMO-M01]
MTGLQQFDLSGQVAVVTGASRGIGAALAVGLAEAGADVALLARSECDAASAAIAAVGRRRIQVKVDIGKPGVCAAALAQVETDLGPPTILVNNAGIIRRADFEDYSRQDWDDVMAVNLDGVFDLSQAFARSCLHAGRKGRIINIASMLSFQGGVRVAAYTASKSALLGLTRALANELAPQGINVNAIAPGYIATDNTAPLRADEARNASILDRIPAGRWGDPTDLVGAAVFLASPAAAYVHGTVLAVDGGWLAR